MILKTAMTSWGKNQYYIPMGFSYDYYYTEEQYNQLYEDNLTRLLLKAIVLMRRAATKYQDILNLLLEILLFSPTPKKLIQGLSRTPINGLLRFYLDSFTAHYTSDKERLAFSAIRKRLTATVNGEPVDIENVNIGFMSCKSTAGTSEI